MARKRKIRVGLIFGGRSAEHEVSLQSAKNVISALDKNKYEPVLIGIGKDGRWYAGESSRKLLEGSKNIHAPDLKTESAIIPTRGEKGIMAVRAEESIRHLDVVFPVLHGTFGEDGTVQGLLRLLDVPFVGSDVLGSAVGMDKDVMKRLLRDAGIPVTDFLVYNKTSKLNYNLISRVLGNPFFVKPANLGSSVGVHKVRSRTEFAKAVHDAFSYDEKILCERFIPGREIECSVLGNENPAASLPGEVVPLHDFYTYEAKYIDENGAQLIIPAKLSRGIVKKIQDLSIRSFEALCLAGMARVDFFLTKEGLIYVNEVNTIPGFTKISMYPKLWEASGVPYAELIDRLIGLAIERFEIMKKGEIKFKI